MRPRYSATKPAADTHGGMRAIVLGRIGYDLFSEQRARPLDQVRRFRAGVGGSSANIAVGLRRLGWEVAMLAAVSDDAVGRFVVRELAGEGIAVGGVQFVRGFNTSLALTEVSPPRGAEQVFYRGRPADAELTWTPRLASAFSRGGAATPAVFLTNGTSLCSRASFAVTRRALRAARAAGMTTVLDVDYRKSSWTSPAAAGRAVRQVWSLTDILIANDEEMRLLATPADARAGTRLEARVAARALRQGVRVAIWKRGVKGSVAFTADGRIACPAEPIAVVSTIGAGDGFAVGFLTGYGRGESLGESLRLASAAAAHVIARVGCADAMPRPRDLARHGRRAGGREK